MPRQRRRRAWLRGGAGTSRWALVSVMGNEGDVVVEEKIRLYEIR
jgi:hypothetical protein